MDPTGNFGEYLDCWRALPRRHHSLLPCVKDCTPNTLGSLLPYIALARYDGKYQMITTFVGTEIERLAGTVTDGMNYYDSMTPDLKKSTHIFHKILLGTPCGAYVSDIVTTNTGAQYRFETMQFPLCDKQGEIKYIMAFGYGRSPVKGRLSRQPNDHKTGNLSDLHFLDVGAGAPDDCIINFKLRPGIKRQERNVDAPRKTGVVTQTE